MKPRVTHYSFGTITVAGQTYQKDILITTDGEIKKRPKNLSKSQYGTSHILSEAEAEAIYQDGVKQIIFGTGMFDRCRLSDEAAAFFESMNCRVSLLPTPKAVKAWNDAPEGIMGLFHISC